MFNKNLSENKLLILFYLLTLLHVGRAFSPPYTKYTYRHKLLLIFLTYLVFITSVFIPIFPHEIFFLPFPAQIQSKFKDHSGHLSKVRLKDISFTKPSIFPIIINQLFALHHQCYIPVRGFSLLFVPLCLQLDTQTLINKEVNLSLNTMRYTAQYIMYLRYLKYFVEEKNESNIFSRCSR